MIDQEAENVTAGVRHLLIQRGVDARNWQAQAEQWRMKADEQRKELDEARSALTDITRYPMGDVLTHGDLLSIVSEMQGIAAAALARAKGLSS